MKKRTRFVMRTIRNGRAKILGRWFYPDEKWLKYDGRLDGLKYHFGLYSTGEKMENFVCLWGSEEEYRSKQVSTMENDPACVDGAYPWAWWETRLE